MGHLRDAQHGFTFGAAEGMVMTHCRLTMRCSERRRAVAVAIGAPRGRRR